MNDTLPKEVHRQKALFSRDLPFKPQYGMMLYVESCANEEINGYFHKNMIGRRSGHESDEGSGGAGEGDSTIIFISSRLPFVLKPFSMNNTLRVILKVLMVITWVLMMGWYISLLLTLLQAYRMYGNMPIGEVPYFSLPMFDFCFVFGFFNFLVMIFLGFPLNLWNMIHEFKFKKISTLLISACYILLALVFIIIWFYLWSYID